MTTRSQSGLTTRRPSRSADVADLDVTPVMNMFIILIPFLVSMAVFTQLAAHHVALPSDDDAGEARTAAEVPLTVAVAADRVVVAWGDREMAALPRPSAAGLDAARLEAVLAAERARRPDVAAVVVAVDAGVSCAEVVACIDACRAVGYTDVGLAAGTGRDGRAAGAEVPR